MSGYNDSLVAIVAIVLYQLFISNLQNNKNNSFMKMLFIAVILFLSRISQPISAYTVMALYVIVFHSWIFLEIVIPNDLTILSTDKKTDYNDNQILVQNTSKFYNKSNNNTNIELSNKSDNASKANVKYNQILNNVFDVSNNIVSTVSNKSQEIINKSKSVVTNNILESKEIETTQNKNIIEGMNNNKLNTLGNIESAIPNNKYKDKIIISKNNNNNNHNNNTLLAYNNIETIGKI